MKTFRFRPYHLLISTLIVILYPVFADKEFQRHGIHVDMKDFKDNIDYDKETRDADSLPFSPDELIIDSDLPPEELQRRLRILANSIDTDKDEILSSEELSRWIIATFKKNDIQQGIEQYHANDLDEDGLVSWREYVKQGFQLDLDEVEKLKNEKDEQSQHMYQMVSDDVVSFEAADKDADGQLTEEEYGFFMHPQYFDHMLDSEVARLLAERDEDLDDQINIEEFSSFSSSDGERRTVDEENFKTYDQDGDGYLNTFEMKNWVLPNYENEAHDEALFLMEKCDTNEDGDLTIDELVHNYKEFMNSRASDYGEEITNLIKDEL